MEERPTDATLLFDARADLAEGPVWDVESGILWWVDILAGRLHRMNAHGDDDWMAVDARAVSAIALRHSPELLAACDDGLWFVDPAVGSRRPFVPLEADRAETRTNDGQVDAAGRFWIGTMGYDKSPIGTLYRVEPDGRAEPVLTSLRVSNGIGWSPDGRTMYFVDTPTGRVDVLDFDVSDGSVANRRPFAVLGPDDGSPDGLAVDAEGGVWIALWGGWGVLRYLPDGSLDRKVALPVAQVTSCAFGGPELEELYITTAAHGLDEAALRGQPHAGGIFRFRPGVAGRPANRFAA